MMTRCYGCGEGCPPRIASHCRSPKRRVFSIESLERFVMDTIDLVFIHPKKYEAEATKKVVAYRFELYRQGRVESEKRRQVRRCLERKQAGIRERESRHIVAPIIYSGTVEMIFEEVRA